MWPYDESVTKLILRVLYSMNTVFFLLLQIITIFNSEVFLDLLIALAPGIFLELPIIVKFHLCWIKDDYYKESFDHMRIDWGRLKEAEKLPLKQAYGEFVFYSKFLFLFAYAPSVLIMVFLFFPKITSFDVPLNQSRPIDLNFPIEYFVDHNKYFYPVIIHISLSVLLLSTVQSGVEVLNWIILLHMMGMFHLLGYLLEHLFDKPENTNDNIDLNTVYYGRIVHIIDVHKRNLKLGDILARCYLESGIIQMFLIILCITSILLKLKRIVSPIEDIRVVIGHCTFSSSVISATYLLLLIPQKVHDTSSDMFIKIYCGRWYMAPIKSQKLLLIPMQRYMKPYKLQYKTLIIAYSQTFAKVSKSSTHEISTKSVESILRNNFDSR
ncbi:uncharacterized protein LOC108631690 isoform X1 [Ceratina calcarata]|uniref:Odorant receptor n=1 Tax=Ceratina calcarata TaxID=156304 RepID=A0AAJ7SB79_9HYME|nr:uncharacterized protein LOC108631690 isoform X1 [Ceratina calcarata]